MGFFDPNALIARARQQTGLEDFGEEPFQDGLEVICAALESEAGLNEAGRASAHESLLGTLSERLRIEDCLRRHPEILQQTLLPQVFVAGLPRTGTTALSQFLSEDPAGRSVRRWELFKPTPPPDRAIGHDPRVDATRATFAARDAAMPQFKTMLPVEAEDPSEHAPLLAFTLRNFHFPSMYNTPTYKDWIFQANMSPAYGYMAKVLKILQWKTPGRFWNLKNPPDVASFEAIRSAFPNCVFVWTHRDPANSMPSLASLITLLRSQTTDHVDKPALMRSLLAFQSQCIERGLAARERLGESHFLDVSQSELGRDTIGVIRNLYERIGLPFTPDYEAHLRRRTEDRPRGQHGKHEYDIAEFGLTPDEIRAAFRPYLERFERQLGGAARARD